MEDQKTKAKSTLLRMLAASPKSKKNLVDKLSLKGYDPGIISEAINDLENVGILNDKIFAQDLITKFTEFKPSGKRKINFELKRRGISSKLREELLSDDDKAGELDRARTVARQRWTRIKNLTCDKKQKKVYDFLMRRGFDFQDCRTAIEELKKNEPYENE